MICQQYDTSRFRVWNSSKSGNLSDNRISKASTRRIQGETIAPEPHCPPGRVKSTCCNYMMIRYTNVWKELLLGTQNTSFVGQSRNACGPQLIHTLHTLKTCGTVALALRLFRSLGEGRTHKGCATCDELGIVITMVCFWKCPPKRWKGMVQFV